MADTISRISATSAGSFSHCVPYQRVRVWVRECAHEQTREAEDVHVARRTTTRAGRCTFAFSPSPQVLVTLGFPFPSSGLQALCTSFASHLKFSWPMIAEMAPVEMGMIILCIRGQPPPRTTTTTTPHTDTQRHTFTSVLHEARAYLDIIETHTSLCTCARHDTRVLMAKSVSPALKS